MMTKNSSHGNYPTWLVPVFCLGVALLHGIFLHGGFGSRDNTYILSFLAVCNDQFHLISDEQWLDIKFK